MGGMTEIEGSGEAMVTMDELVWALGRTRIEIGEAILSGTLPVPHFKIGNSYRFPRPAVEKILGGPIPPNTHNPDVWDNEEIPPNSIWLPHVAKRRRWVYYVQPEQGGPIKIGKADRLEQRLPSLNTQSPYPLRLLAIERNLRTRGLDMEARRHKQFDLIRLHGEWFHPSDALLQHIESACTTVDLAVKDAVHLIHQEMSKRRNSR